MRFGFWGSSGRRRTAPPPIVICASSGNDSAKITKRVRLILSKERLVIALLFRQQFLNHLLGLFVSFGAAVAELNDPILIDNEMRRPYVAKIIAPDRVIVIHHDRIFDAFLLHG